MESNYDEDLSENVFFKVLKQEHPELLQKAILEGWIVCVPRAGSFPKFAFTLNDFCGHILIPSDELPVTHFRALNDRSVKISNRTVIVESDVNSSFSTHILFEETFHTNDKLKYKVLCLEFPLQQYVDRVQTESGVVTVLTLRDSIDLLWTEGCKEILERMDEQIQQFLLDNEHLEFAALRIQKDLVGGLYTSCLQTALKDARLKEKTSSNKYLLDNVKVSVESYVHHGIYKKLIKGITGCTAYEDACFNKIVRNLSDIQLRDLDIPPDFSSVIPKARSELRRVENYSTVLGKVGCLRKAIAAITGTDPTKTLTTDDLLPMLVFLVIRSGVPNWIAHLTFVKEFCFSSSDYHADQQMFLVTSLEAAIAFIKDDLLVGPPEPECLFNDEDPVESDKQKLEVEDEVEECKRMVQAEVKSLQVDLFEAATRGDLDTVKRILDESENSQKLSLEGLNLCHPLCSCDKCEREMSWSMCNMAPTVNSRNDFGMTVLHVAALHDRLEVVHYLLSLGASPEKTDYKGYTALHYACARGHRRTVLLLIQLFSHLNLQDNDGNTPLHLATNNGHESCVKALLFTIQYSGAPLNVNAVNNQGDSALHLAARWGYCIIVSVLLEYGASCKIKNKRKETPLDLAHNVHLHNILSAGFSSKLDPVPHRSISVAAASVHQLDLSEEITNSPCNSGIRPNSTEQMRKVERTIRAITNGDTRLACFYLGVDVETAAHAKSASCHPLCSCSANATTTTNGPSAHTTRALSDTFNWCNAHGLTPLHVASKFGRSELVDILINSGADVNLRASSNGMTPLHLACLNRHTRVVTALLECGKCDMNVQDTYGNTPMHYCCQNNYFKLVNILLIYHPDLTLRNKDGKTPLDEAKDMSISTYQLLAESGNLNKRASSADLKTLKGQN